MKPCGLERKESYRLMEENGNWEREEVRRERGGGVEAQITSGACGLFRWHVSDQT